MSKVAIFLFDATGIMAEPWLNAGYECWIVDIKHPTAYDKGRVTRNENLVKVHADLRLSWMPPRNIVERVKFLFAFPPCTHLSNSGNKHKQFKGHRKLAESADYFATAVELAEWLSVPYMIENPVGSMSTYWRKSDYTFHPHYFTGYEPDDNYTKRTCLWTGCGFVMPERNELEGLPEPDDRIHKAAPSSDRGDVRSVTPRGFARAVFDANSRKDLRVVA